MTKVGKLAKNTGVLAIGSFSSKILIFLLVPLYTAVLTPGEFGAYEIIYNSCGLLIPMLTLNVSDAMLRFPLEKNADIPRIARIGLGLTLLSGVVVLLGQVLPGAPWNSLQGSQYIALLYLSNALYQLLVLLARGTERFKDIAIAGVMSAFTMTVLNILMLLVVRLGLDGFFLANSIGMLLPALYLVCRLRAFIFAPAESSGGGLVLRMVRYSIPLAMTVIGWWFINVSDRYIVLFLDGVEANGLYSIAYKIPAILSTVAGIFIQAWQVSAIKEFDRHDSDGFLSGIFDATEMCLVLLCSLLIPLSPLLAFFLFSGDFFEAWIYVPFLLVYVIFNTMGGMWGPFFSAGYDTAPMAVSTAMGGLVNVALGIPLVMLIGVQGAAVSSLAAGLVNWAWRGIKVKRHIEVNFHMGRSLVMYAILVLQGIAMIAGLPVPICALLQGVIILGFFAYYRKGVNSGFSMATALVKSKKSKI